MIQGLKMNKYGMKWTFNKINDKKYSKELQYYTVHMVGLRGKGLCTCLGEGGQQWRVKTINSNFYLSMYSRKKRKVNNCWLVQKKRFKYHEKYVTV